MRSMDEWMNECIYVRTQVWRLMILFNAINLWTSVVNPTGLQVRLTQSLPDVSRLLYYYYYYYYSINYQGKLLGLFIHTCLNYNDVRKTDFAHILWIMKSITIGDTWRHKREPVGNRFSWNGNRFSKWTGFHIPKCTNETWSVTQLKNEHTT